MNMSELVDSVDIVVRIPHAPSFHSDESTMVFRYSEGLVEGISGSKNKDRASSENLPYFRVFIAICV